MEKSFIFDQFLNAPESLTQRLDESMNRVRSGFFSPRWNVNGFWHWGISPDAEFDKISDTRSVALCFQVEIEGEPYGVMAFRESFVSNADDDNLDSVVIHEICHAITWTWQGEHTRKWFNRMLKAGKKAMNLGRIDLLRCLDWDMVRTLHPAGITGIGAEAFPETQGDMHCQ